MFFLLDNCDSLVQEFSWRVIRLVGDASALHRPIGIWHQSTVRTIGEHRNALAVVWCPCSADASRASLLTSCFIHMRWYFCKLCICRLRVNIFFIQCSFGSCCFRAWETIPNKSEWQLSEWFTLNHKLIETLLTNSIHCKKLNNSFTKWTSLYLDS